MKKVYLLLDVGGTQIKAGIVREDGEMVGEIKVFPSEAKAEKEKILEHFAGIVKALIECIGQSEVLGIGMAFPGPFDYEKGISLMKGLDKYDSIYGISIEKELKKRINGAEKWQFCFLNDVEAFAIGESWFGEAKEEKKLLCLCIGTGAGSAFLQNHQILKEEKNGVPKNGWIYHISYKETIIDDYLSVRGLAKISKEIIGQELEGKILYENCLKGEQGALKVYKAFGEDVTDAILPFAEAFKPDAVVFGGQIAKSFCFFGQKFHKKCKQKDITIYLELETSVRVIQGLFAKFREEKRKC